MSSPVVHTVSLVLPAADYTEAGRHQATAKHWAKHSLPNLLNNHLERLHPGDEIVYIEKVTIEIADYPWNLTDAEWQSTIAAAIQKEQPAPDTLALIVQQWLFYLQHGCFEKAALLTDRKTIEEYLLSHTVQLPAILLRAISNGVSLPALQRLFYQHAAALATLFTAVLLDLPEADVVQAYGVIRQRLKTDPAATYTLLSKLAVTNRAVAAKEKTKLLETLLGPESSKAADGERMNKEEAEQAASGHKEDAVTDVFIECPSAGLVLLFPYIKRFFENGQLLKDDAFVDEVAQIRAVQALHFLATGASTGDEAALVLPKLLCGIELSTYIELEGELPASLQTEGNELLQAVIDHWKVLQHTSVEGFRETFLQRQGKLIKKGNSYTLQVEESGVDILLNSIPWGFRSYRLPWMSYHLITEWY